jgi:hypothetical protein
MLRVSVILIIADIKYMIFKTQNKMNIDYKFVKSHMCFILSFERYLLNAGNSTNETRSM